MINTLLALIDILKSTNWYVLKNREKKMDLILRMSHIKATDNSSYSNDVTSSEGNTLRFH